MPILGSHDWKSVSYKLRATNEENAFRFEPRGKQQSKREVCLSLKGNVQANSNNKIPQSAVVAQPQKLWLGSNLSGMFCRLQVQKCSAGVDRLDE